MQESPVDGSADGGDTQSIHALTKTSTNTGTVVTVRGSKVDSRFHYFAPAVQTLLRAGENDAIAIEVQAQRGPLQIRGIGLTAIQGFSRGMPVRDAGAPLKAPVGVSILSRMFDVFGNVIDRLPPPENIAWRPVHQAPPLLPSRSTQSEIFEAGIKVIDMLVLLERGGKAGLFGQMNEPPGSHFGSAMQR